MSGIVVFTLGPAIGEKYYIRHLRNYTMRLYTFDSFDVKAVGQGVLTSVILCVRACMYILGTYIQLYMHVT